MAKLTKFDGLVVEKSTIAITNAGDGLSKALAIDPVEYHTGDKVYVVLECEVAKVTFEPVSAAVPKGPQVRKHSFRAGVSTVVDQSLVLDVIEAQRKLNDEAEGKQALPFDSDQNEL